MPRPSRRRSIRLAAALVTLACAFFAWGFASVHAARSAQAAAESQADQAEATLADVQAQVEAARTLTETTDGDWTLNTTQSFADGDDFDRMQDAVADFLAGTKYDCGLVIEDLGSGATVSYNADTMFYPASSIKALYLCSLFENEVETGEVSLSSVEDQAASVVIYSDNDAYDDLWHEYGSECFASWAQDAGVSDATLANIKAHTYPRLTANDMALLWRKAYDYLSSDTRPAQALAEYLDEPETTAIGTVAEEDGLSSWSKAGWFYDHEGNADPTTADGGIVLADGRPYLICVLTTAPADFDALTELIEKLDDAEPALAPPASGLAGSSTSDGSGTSDGSTTSA